VTPQVSLLLAVCALVVACSQPPGPPLTISNIVVLEPLPGSGVAAAYLEIENHSDQALTISHVSSPQFGRIEIHESVVENDVARMRSLPSLLIGKQTKVVFERGGKHLMLFTAGANVAVGAPVTIEFHDDANGLVSVTTNVRARQEFSE
jgi:hypothetical protein